MEVFLCVHLAVRAIFHGQKSVLLCERVASVLSSMYRIASGLLSWARQRPKLTALILYAFLAILFFSPGLLPGHTTSGADYLWNAAPWNTVRPKSVPQVSFNPPLFGSNDQLVDPVTVFGPFLEYTRSQLPHIPLWDPYIMAGTPYLADMQSAVFSPFSIPAYVLPFWWSLSVIAVLKLLVAAMGAFLLARALRMRFAGAFVAGTVFGFGLFMVAWLPWPLANVFPFIPWLLLASERVVQRPGAISGAGLAVVVALQFFGGHPESSFQALFATGAFFVLRVLQSRGGGVVKSMKAAAHQGRSRLAALGRTTRGPLITFILALVAGTALAAIVIVPFLELLHNSNDLSARPRSGVYVQPKYFLATLLPGYYPTAFEIETAFYAGALPLILSVIALLRPRVERVAVAGFAAVSLLVVLGIQPFFGIVGHAPGFDLTYVSRLTILYLLGVALLAGWGLDDLVRRRPVKAVAPVTGIVTAGLLILPVIVVIASHGTSIRFLGHALRAAFGFIAWPKPGMHNALPVIHLAGLIVWVVVASAAGVLLYLRMRRGLATWLFAVLAVVLVVGDLFQAGMGENPAIPDSHAEQPITPAIRFLEEQRPARYVAVTPTVGVNPLPPDVNINYGLYDARGYDYPVDKHFALLWTRYVAGPTPLLWLDTPAVPLLNLELDPTALRVLSLLGVRDILQQKGQPPPTVTDLRAVYRGPDATIYANDDALPRVWLVDGEDVVRGEDAALTQVVSARFDPRKVVITETRLRGLSQGASEGSSPGEAHLSRYGAEQVTIEAHANRLSELVLSDLCYPGWHATVDGHPARIDRVDYLLRGVTLPPGTHRVEFSYDPASFRIGWVVSLVALLTVAGMTIFAVRRRRRGSLVRSHAHRRS
jgi:hypothetical protein